MKTTWDYNVSSTHLIVTNININANRIDFSDKTNFNSEEVTGDISDQ